MATYSHNKKVCGIEGLYVGVAGSEKKVADGTGKLFQQEVEITSNAAELNLVDNADRIEKVAKIALSAVNTAGGVFAWQNDEGASIIVTGLYLNVTTKTTGACSLDCGTTATSATTLSDNLINAVDVNSAAGVFDNITDKGTNGKSRQLLASGKWVTGSVVSGGASAGIVGFAYIRYIVI